MPVVLVFQGLTQKRYAEATEKLTGGKSRMEMPSDWPVEGVLVHIAGQGANGFRIVDVWESEDALQRFSERLKPVLEEVGIDEECGPPSRTDMMGFDRVGCRRCEAGAHEYSRRAGERGEAVGGVLVVQYLASACPR